MLNDAGALTRVRPYTETPKHPPEFSRLDSFLYLTALAAFVAVIGLSAWLRPDPAGAGTHTQLHLPPCGVLLVFGKPCPSCGMTTAFAWMARGRVTEAFRVQPAGAGVFLVALCWWLYLPIAWHRRRPFPSLLECGAFLPSVLGLIVLILGVWLWRLFP